jgi:hypothetical protein
MAPNANIRDVLARSLEWSDAHISFEDAVRDMPVELRGVRPAGLPHSAWELVEHIRIAQRDILDFCGAATYDEKQWPGDYWPPSPEPPNDAAWEQSLNAIRDDGARLQALTRDVAIDLSGVVPHGTNQTYLREILLVLDHNAYHVGQLVIVRRLLDTWPPG